MEDTWQFFLWRNFKYKSLWKLNFIFYFGQYGDTKLTVKFELKFLINHYIKWCEITCRILIHNFFSPNIVEIGMTNDREWQTYFEHESILRVSSTYLGVSSCLVYNLMMTIDMGSDICEKLGSNISSKKQNRDLIYAFKTKITKSPTTSIQVIALELRESPKTVRTAKHEDLGLKPYFWVPRHLFVESMKAGKI